MRRDLRAWHGPRACCPVRQPRPWGIDKSSALRRGLSPFQRMGTQHKSGCCVWRGLRRPVPRWDLGDAGSHRDSPSPAAVVRGRQACLAWKIPSEVVSPVVRSAARWAVISPVSVCNGLSSWHFIQFPDVLACVSPNPSPSSSRQQRGGALSAGAPSHLAPPHSSRRALPVVRGSLSVCELSEKNGARGDGGAPAERQQRAVQCTLLGSHPVSSR